MNEHRLINCKFINAGGFKTKISNKAKLLYLLMFTNADDRGFVDTTTDLINSLEKSEQEWNKNISMELLENTYQTALYELLDKGYLYEFVDKHENKIHLIRHWFLHNKYIKGLWTNYRTFLNKVDLVDNEYVRKPLKESNIKDNKVNNNHKVNNEDISEEKWKELFDDTDNEKKELEEEMPFPL